MRCRVNVRKARPLQIPVLTKKKHVNNITQLKIAHMAMWTSKASSMFY